MKEFFIIDPKKIVISSIEISKKTGKKHLHVLRDIENLYKELEKDVSKIGSIYLDKYNRSQKCLNLPIKDAYNLLLGYSGKMRDAMLTYIQQLEEKARKNKEIRQESTKTRNRLTSVLKDRGFSQPNEYQKFTVIQKNIVGIGKKNKDKFDKNEFLLVTAMEALTEYNIDNSNAYGFKSVMPIGKHTAESIRDTVFCNNQQKETLFAGLEALK